MPRVKNLHNHLNIKYKPHTRDSSPWRAASDAVWDNDYLGIAELFQTPYQLEQPTLSTILRFITLKLVINAIVQ